VQVDVRDVARAHILCLTNPLASNKRIILVSGLVTPQLVINAIQKNFPELRNRVIEGQADKILPDGVEPTGWDTKRSSEVFGEKLIYKGLEETIVDLVGQLVSLEKEWDV
jgi:nucleoside-diphosphate-sugar epimerase